MKRYTLDSDYLVERYLSGVSEKGLADELGITRGPIRRHLLEAGVQPRGRSEAETLRWTQMTSGQRAAQVAAAHAAVLGTKKSPADLAARAIHKQQNWTGLITPSEATLRQMLDERGLPTVPQQAIGPYNCDLGAFPVAVEIYGGNWHWYGRHIARTPERFRYLFNRGWHIIAVHVVASRPLKAAAADYIVAFHQQASRNPAAPREYRVIRGDAQPLASGCENDDEISLKSPFNYRRNRAARDYEIAAG